MSHVQITTWAHCQRQVAFFKMSFCGGFEDWGQRSVNPGSGSGFGLRLRSRSGSRSKVIQGHLRCTFLSLSLCLNPGYCHTFWVLINTAPRYGNFRIPPQSLPISQKQKNTKCLCYKHLLPTTVHFVHKCKYWDISSGIHLFIIANTFSLFCFYITLIDKKLYHHLGSTLKLVLERLTPWQFTKY